MDKLNQYRGKIVLLNFWAIWCKYCIQEMPDLEAVYRQYRDQGVVVLAVNVTEDEAAILDYAKKSGLTFPMLRDTDQLASKAYKVQAFPTTVFMDRQGKVRYTQIGAMKKSFMVQQIEALLH
jgi:thiol-disulfide isomerase/thioredoxin